MASIVPLCARQGFQVAAVHGDLSQHDRNAAVANFKSGTTPILIATDVAARGLDIPDVEVGQAKRERERERARTRMDGWMDGCSVVGFDLEKEDGGDDDDNNNNNNNDNNPHRPPSSGRDQLLVPPDHRRLRPPHRAHGPRG